MCCPPSLFLCMGTFCPPVLQQWIRRWTVTYAEWQNKQEHTFDCQRDKVPVPFFTSVLLGSHQHVPHQTIHPTQSLNRAFTPLLRVPFNVTARTPFVCLIYHTQVGSGHFNIEEQGEYLAEKIITWKDITLKLTYAWQVFTGYNICLVRVSMMFWDGFYMLKRIGELLATEVIGYRSTRSQCIVMIGVTKEKRELSFPCFFCVWWWWMCNVTRRRSHIFCGSCDVAAILVARKWLGHFFLHFTLTPPPPIIITFNRCLNAAKTVKDSSKDCCPYQLNAIMHAYGIYVSYFERFFKRTSLSHSFSTWME